MPAEVATLAVGLVLNTGKFFGVLGMTLNTAASKMTAWGLRTTMLVSAPFIALTAITGRFAMDFDQEMRNINAALQLPEEGFQQLRKDVIELSMDSRSTAIDIAQSLRMVTAAAGDQFDAWKLVEIATHAAGAAYTTTAKTSQFLISMMRAYELTLDDANEVMDRGIWLTQKSGITFDELASVIGRVAPMSALANISIEEMFGTLRSLQIGLGNTNTAVVSYQRILQKILDPTEEMKMIFEAAGYESGAAALKVLGLEKTIRLLTRAVGGDIAKMIEMTGMIQAWRGLAVLMGDDVRGLADSVDLMSEGFEGAMESARTQQYLSLNSVLKKLKNTFMAFALSLWEVPMPALVALVKWLQKVALGFMSLSDQTKQWIIIIVAAAAALGPVILLLGKLLSIGAMIVSVALNPLILALAAVAFAAYKWVTARYHIESFQDAIVAFSDIAARALEWVSERLVGFVDLIGQMATWGAQAIGAFAQGIVSGLGLVVQAINYVVGGIAALLGPGSPPAALPNIVKWGQSAINEFLQGMTMADFGILDELGGAIESHLRALKWDSADVLSAALIRARVALARVLAEASVAGEASAEAWADLRHEIGDAAGEMEQYIRARIAAAAAESELAQAELARKQVTKQLEDEKYALETRHKRSTRQLEQEGHAIELRHKEELREVDEKVKTAEEALADFREQSAEIPERFTRGRRKQLEVELRAAQKERDSVKDRQEIETDEFETRRYRIRELQKIEMEEFETRRRHIIEEADAQVEAAQARREQAKQEADWLGAVIKQKQKIVSLYKEEQEGAEGLELDLSQLTPEALDIGDAIGGIKTEFDKAKEAAAGLFGVWKAFWAGLTGVDIDEPLKNLTDEEFRMYKAGLKVNEAWEDFTDVLDDIKEALDPILKLFRQLFGEEEELDWREIIKGDGALGALGDTMAGALLAGFDERVRLWFEETWPNILAGAATAVTVFLATMGAVFDTFVNTTLPHLKDAFDELTLVMEELDITWEDVWGALGRATVIVIEIIGAILLGLVMIVVGVVNGIARALLRLIKGWRRVIGGWRKILDGIAVALAGWFLIIEGILSGDLEQVIEGVKKVFEGWLSFLEGILDVIAGTFEMVLGTILDFIWGFVEGVVDFFKSLFDRLIGTSLIPDIVNGIIGWFAKLPGALLGKIGTFLDDLFGKFVNFKDRLLGLLGELVQKAGVLFGDLVGGAIGWFDELYRKLVGGSIVPDMVKDINASLGGLSPTLGALTGMTPAAAMPGAMPGGFAGQLVIQNYWDASLGAKDRAELAAMMETTTYTALERVYGGA